VPVPMTTRRPPRAAPRTAPKPAGDRDATKGRRAARGVASALKAKTTDAERDEYGPQRIAKLLARAGVGSRRDVERMVEEGRIALNGVVIVQPAPLLTSLEGLTVD